MAEFGVAPAAHTQRPLHEPSTDRGMIFIPGGTFRMGSDRHYPEEAPVHRVTVGGFWIDRTPVTNRDFRKFVNATGVISLIAAFSGSAKPVPTWWLVVVGLLGIAAGDHRRDSAAQGDRQRMDADPRRRSVPERGRGELLPFYKFWFLTRHFRPSTGVELAAIGDNLRRSC
jgi:formylglycine-generating enzyme required for sulfatase activity